MIYPVETQELIDALNSVVIENSQNDSSTNRHGLSVLLINKNNPDFKNIPNEYLQTDYATDFQWDEFVNEFLNSFKSKQKFLIKNYLLQLFTNIFQKFKDIINYF